MKIFSYQESLSEYHANFKAAENAPHLGFSALEFMIPGLLPGSLTVLAGATSMGKTSFLANCAYHMAAKQKKHVLFFSLESGHSVSGVVEKISGNKKIEHLHIVKPDTQITLAETATFIKENLHFAEVVMIDHIHYLLQVKNESVQANIGQMVREIQTLAFVLEIPIILVAHVRKLINENAVPGLNDLKDSSALYQDPANVLIIHRFKKDAIDLAVGKDSAFQNNGLVIVAKNRDFGKTGTLKLNFDPEKLAFAVADEWIYDAL